MFEDGTGGREGLAAEDGVAGRPGCASLKVSLHKIFP